MGAPLDDDDGTSEARTQLSGLLAIAAFAFLLVLGLGWFLLLFPGRDGTLRKAEPTEKLAIAGLSAVDSSQLDMIFGVDDYRKLRTRPELKSTCVRLRRDRRRIALLWLGDLQRDVHLVWEFRRFLVGNGLTVTVRDEFGIGVGSCLALLRLGVARIVVLTCGPFTLPRVAQNAARPVESLSSRAALLLARVPAALRTQLEQKWMKHVLTLHPA
jgi:hypothetical protein